MTNAWTKRNGYDIDGYCMIVQNGSPDRGIQMIVLAVWSIWDTDYEDFFAIHIGIADILDGLEPTLPPRPNGLLNDATQKCMNETQHYLLSNFLIFLTSKGGFKACLRWA